MSKSDDFLARWSRRKRAAAEGNELPEGAGSVPGPKGQGIAPQNPAPNNKPAEDGTAFDLSKLPSLESIGPDADVSLFLRPGVPAGLAREALRRAWAADPAIRNFVGLAEYDWDFNSNDIHGFAALADDPELRRALAKAAGVLTDDDAESEASGTMSPAKETADSGQSEDVSTQATSASPQTLDQENTDRRAELLRRDEILVATQHDSSPEGIRARRKHGGALPG
jgi:hypothetical protein